MVKKRNHIKILCALGSLSIPALPPPCLPCPPPCLSSSTSTSASSHLPWFVVQSSHRHNPHHRVLVEFTLAVHQLCPAPLDPHTLVHLAGQARLEGANYFHGKLQSDNVSTMHCPLASDEEQWNVLLPGCMLCCRTRPHAKLPAHSLHLLRHVPRGGLQDQGGLLLGFLLHSPITALLLSLFSFLEILIKIWKHSFDFSASYSFTMRNAAQFTRFDHLITDYSKQNMISSPTRSDCIYCKHLISEITI